MRFRSLAPLVFVLTSACGSRGLSPAPIPTPPLVHDVPALRVATPRTPGACCHDASCDRQEYAKHGGVCPGDPRINGPQPVEVIGKRVPSTH